MVITMENAKALFIIVNAGFAQEIIDLARSEGASGATVLNSRGEGVQHKTILGITVDSEREMVLTVVEAEVADGIMKAVKEKAGIHTPARGVCFFVPVGRVTEMAQLEVRG